MQAEVFYIYHRGEQRGPYTMKQVNHLYRSTFIDDDSMYWREGMEQWQPVTEIVERRRRKRRWAFWGVLFSVLAAIGLFVWVFGNVTMSAWREMTSGEYTEQSAWWRARGFVRGQLSDAEHVDFEPFANAVVKLHDKHEATVTLAGYLQTDGGPSTRRAWQVRMQFDPLRAEWEPREDKSQ
jgi:hypothetical protein